MVDSHRLLLLSMQLWLSRSFVELREYNANTQVHWHLLNVWLGKTVLAVMHHRQRFTDNWMKSGKLSPLYTHQTVSMCKYVPRRRHATSEHPAAQRKCDPPWVDHPNINLHVHAHGWIEWYIHSSQNEPFIFPYFRGTLLNSGHSCFASDAAQLRWVLVFGANRTRTAHTSKSARTLYTICCQCVPSMLNSLSACCAVTGLKNKHDFWFWCVASQRRPASPTGTVYATSFKPNGFLGIVKAVVFMVVKWVLFFGDSLFLRPRSVILLLFTLRLNRVEHVAVQIPCCISCLYGGECIH